MLATLPDPDLAAAAITEAHRAHLHPLARDVAAAVALLSRALIRGLPWKEAVTLTAESRPPETRLALTGNGELSDSDFSPDALRAAVHFVGTSDTLSTALEHSIEFAGPANYCPVLVGSIGGARWGAEAVPSSLLAPHAGLLPRLGEASGTLARGWRNAA
jgi:ADP-ribosylglycohydrolase